MTSLLTLCSIKPREAIKTTHVSDINKNCTKKRLDTLASSSLLSERFPSKSASNSRLEMTSQQKSEPSTSHLAPQTLLRATSFSDVGGFHCGKRKCKECTPTVSLRSLFTSGKKQDSNESSCASAYDFTLQQQRRNTPRSKSFSHYSDSKTPATPNLAPQYGSTLSPRDAVNAGGRLKGRLRHHATEADDEEVVGCVEDSCCDISIQVPQIQLHNESGCYVIDCENDMTSGDFNQLEPSMNMTSQDRCRRANDVAREVFAMTSEEQPQGRSISAPATPTTLCKNNLFQLTNNEALTSTSSLCSSYCACEPPGSPKHSFSLEIGEDSLSDAKNSQQLYDQEILLTPAAVHDASRACDVNTSCSVTSRRQNNSGTTEQVRKRRISDFSVVSDGEAFSFLTVSRMIAI